VRRFEMRQQLYTVLVCVMTTGCLKGPLPSSAPLANQPRGALIAVGVSTGEYQGELLDVRDTGVVVRTDEWLLLIEYTAMRYVRAELMHGGAMAPARAYERRDALKLRSRFPQGLSPDLERELLRSTGQEGLRIIAAGG
jgi:hypothetical protein